MIAIFSVPFSGHLNILVDFIYKYANNLDNITLVIVGWKNLRLDENVAKKLINVCDIKEFYTDYDLSETDPMVWTLPRVFNLIRQCYDCISSLKNVTDIIYDFFAIEGHDVGKSLSIPTICSIPAFYGKKTQVKAPLDFAEPLSDGFIVYGDWNIVWSFDDIKRNIEGRSNQKIIYSGFKQEFIMNNKTGKNIYISFGTVVMNNVWIHNESVRLFVTKFFKQIINIFADTEYTVCIATQGRIKFDNIPSNFVIKDSFCQKQLMILIDLFITHGGNNSYNEAILYNVPMIVIPFFGDQHEVAENCELNEFGKAFHLDDKNKLSTHGSKYREIFDKQLISTVNEILNNPKYKNNLQKIKKQEIDFTSFFTRKLEFYNGDLLYGTTVDRKYYVNNFDKPENFKIGEFQPFSRIMINNDILPAIVDIYHDVIYSDNYESELLCSNKNYTSLLQEYNDYLEGKMIIKRNETKKDYVKLCCHGIDFFSAKGFHIHFINWYYSKEKNFVTSHEINHIIKNKLPIKFYRIIQDRIIHYFPEEIDYKIENRNNKLKKIINRIIQLCNSIKLNRQRYNRFK